MHSWLLSQSYVLPWLMFYQGNMKLTSHFGHLCLDILHHITRCDGQLVNWSRLACSAHVV